MKNLLITALLFLAVIPAIAQIKQTAEVSYQSSSNGVLYVKTTGYEKNQNEAKKYALTNAFEVLLFKGIPNSPYNKAMVSDKEKNIKYFDSFYSKEKYKEYIVLMRLEGKPQKIKREYIFKAIYYMGINVEALKKELENNKIIQPFGVY